MKHVVIILVLALAATPRVADAECRAVVVLEGDAALVDTVDTALQQRGIATRATEDCPSAKARIDRRGTAIALTVVDPAGRRSERTLVDVAAATSVIESWARQDMNASLLLGFTVPDAPAPVEEIARDAPAPRTMRRRDPFTAVIAGESSTDGTDTWLGARASACVRLGPICAGGLARYASSGSKKDGGGDRTTIDVLGGVDLAIPLGARAAIVVGAAIGGGWFSTPYAQGEAMLTSTTTGLRLDGHASFDYHLGRHLSLHVGISGSGSPSAPVTIGDGGDAGTRTNDEPRGLFRGDVGLRIGVP